MPTGSDAVLAEVTSRFYPRQLVLDLPTPKGYEAELVGLLEIQ